MEEGLASGESRALLMLLEVAACACAACGKVKNSHLSSYTIIAERYAVSSRLSTDVAGTVVAVARRVASVSSRRWWVSNGT